MYQSLTLIHSLLRWLVLFSLVCSIGRACIGYFRQSLFTPTDNAIRHWTATIAHVQLLVGMLLYSQSPVVQYFWHNLHTASSITNLLFFGIIHIATMLVAIIVLTIGSAKAKRALHDFDKFKTIWVWYSLSLLLILLAIPWPFSPLAQRPLIR